MLSLFGQDGHFMPRSRLRLTTVFLNAARLSLVVQLVELGFHGGRAEMGSCRYVYNRCRGIDGD